MTLALQFLSYFASSNQLLIIDYLVELKVTEKMALMGFVLETLKAELTLVQLVSFSYYLSCTDHWSGYKYGAHRPRSSTVPDSD